MTAVVCTQDLNHSIHCVQSNLETVRQEHHFLLSSSSTDDGKRSHVKQTLESIDLGLAEALVLLQLEHHINELDSETFKLILQVQRLRQENNWLRDELSVTEQHLQTSTQIKHDYERDIRLLNESLAAISTETFNVNDSTDIEHEQTENTDQHVQTRNQSTEIPARFRTLHNLVLQYAQAGRYEVAVPLCRQALEDLEKTHGHMHPDVATMLNILALVYRDQNKFKEALQLLTEALTIREKVLGVDHPAVAATLNNLAVLHGKKNRYKEAGR
jgi:kinesin light chain